MARIILRRHLYRGMSQVASAKLSVTTVTETAEAVAIGGTRALCRVESAAAGLSSSSIRNTCSRNRERTRRRNRAITTHNMCSSHPSNSDSSISSNASYSFPIRSSTGLVARVEPATFADLQQVESIGASSWSLQQFAEELNNTASEFAVVRIKQQECASRSSSLWPYLLTGEKEEEGEETLEIPKAGKVIGFFIAWKVVD